MTFDRQLARELHLSDRDVAPFFAGRHAEIASFNAALDTARQKAQAVFRIYQGAPGCGKTSLADHLSQISGEHTLFTRFSESDDFDKESLAIAIHEAAAAANKPAEIVKEVAEIALSLIGKDRLAHIVKSSGLKAISKSADIVIHIDEAHSMGDKFNPFLKTLHAKGIGWPCVVLLTGLSQTQRRIESIPGMSRLAEDATHSMGAMALGECVDSTMNMLNTIGATGDHEDAAQRIARVSFGWPRHLNRAQNALRDELLLEDVDGDLERADFGRIKDKSDESRARYYASRINDPLLAQDEALTLRMLDALRETHSINTIRELASLCKRVIERHGVHGDFPFEPEQGLAFAEALVQRGIVVESSTGFEIAIPSMADWAHDHIN